jgi:hypothetical protein
MRFYLHYKKGTFQNKGLYFGFHKLLEGSLTLGLFLLQPLKILIDLSLSRLYPSFD